MHPSSFILGVWNPAVCKYFLFYFRMVWEGCQEMSMYFPKVSSHVQLSLTHACFICCYCCKEIKSCWKSLVQRILQTHNKRSSSYTAVTWFSKEYLCMEDVEAYLGGYIQLCHMFNLTPLNWLIASSWWAYTSPFRVTIVKCNLLPATRGVSGPEKTVVEKTIWTTAVC